MDACLAAGGTTTESRAGGAAPGRTVPRALLGALAALVLAVLALVGGPLPAAHAASGIDQVAQALKKSPVYVDPRAAGQLPAADADALAKKIKDADKPVFVAVLPRTAEFPPATVLRDLRTAVGITGVYAIRLGTGFNAGADPQVMPHTALVNVVTEVRDSYRDNPKAELNSFVDQADAQATGHAPDSWGGGSGGGGGATGAIVLGAVVVAAGGGGYLLYRRAKRKRTERERAELERLRTVVDEDITAFGEELDRLDFQPSAPSADDAQRQDYTLALDCYDRAKAAMEAARRPQDVTAVTRALEEGRFALATLAARRTGRPLPERRPPCFFDPRHGPSVQDVQWAPPGGAVRTVPACAADATRIADGYEPASRTVQTDHGPQPYWNAGPAYGPWAGGYFGGGMLPGLLMGTMLGGMLSGPGYYGGGYGYGDGGFDGGFGGDDDRPEGGDYSGGDFNPSDFGGGFDGGDFGGGGDSGGGFGGGDW